MERFARAFAEAGFVVLVHDHRHFGASDGVERGDVDPWQQIADWRRAISFLESRPEVDAAQIGIWGTSYAGGHAIVLGATDRRLKAVVAQVPTISGFEQGLRRVAPDGIAALDRAFAEDDRGPLRGEPLRRQLVVSDDPANLASYRSKDAIDFYLQPTPPGIWENSVTIRSTRAARMYEPGIWCLAYLLHPLLMVVALSDTMTVTDLALAAYERALEPKNRVPPMSCQGMDSPQIPHRDAVPPRCRHLRRAGPMEAIPVGVPPGQLSRSLVNPVPVSRLLLWWPSQQV